MPSFSRVWRTGSGECSTSRIISCLAAAQLGDAVLAAKTGQDDADLLLRRKLSPGSAADLLHNLFCRFLHRPGFLSHLRSFNGYDGPEILPSSTGLFCLVGADAGQA